MVEDIILELIGEETDTIKLLSSMIGYEIESTLIEKGISNMLKFQTLCAIISNYQKYLEPKTNSESIEIEGTDIEKILKRKYNRPNSNPRILFLWYLMDLSPEDVDGINDIYVGYSLEKFIEEHEYIDRDYKDELIKEMISLDKLKEWDILIFHSLLEEKLMIKSEVKAIIRKKISTKRNLPEEIKRSLEQHLNSIFKPYEIFSKLRVKIFLSKV